MTHTPVKKAGGKKGKKRPVPASDRTLRPRKGAEHLTKPGFRRAFRRAGIVGETRNSIVASRAHLEEFVTRLVRHQESLLKLNTRMDPVTRKAVPIHRTLNERTVRRAFEEVCPGVTVYSGEA